MTANVDAMVREGIRAYRAGKKAEARTLLEKAAELDAYNEQAWMWLSAVVDTPEEQRICLENVLTINPDNQNAKQGLQMLSGGTAAPPSAAQPSSKPASPFTIEDIPSSVEWEQPPTATSSASSTARPAKELSSQEYDSWVAGLGLGSSSSSGDETSSPQSSALSNAEDIFGSGFFDDDDDAEDDMDDFLSDIPKATARPSNDLLADSSFDDGPFSTAGLDLDDDLELPEPVSKPATSKMSPVETKSRTSPVERSSAGGILVDDNFDTELNYEDDPAEFFQRIPKNIPPTRLPGTKERPNPILVLTLIILVIVNLGAVVMLIGKF